MSYSPFSEQSLARLIRAPDPQRFDLDLKHDRDQILKDASSRIDSDAVNLADFQTHQIRGKPCVSYSDFHSHLVLRAIVHHLARRYRVGPPSRDAIVRGVIEGLIDGTPLYVTRRDISSFYESVPISPLKHRLLTDVSIPGSMRSYLRVFFECHCAGKKSGIPRGVGLSALLAEMAMAPFDKSIKNIPGVYRYFRFSDDIIVLSTSPHSNIDPLIQKQLPAGMVFNDEKKQDIALDEPSKGRNARISFEYLGYKFNTETFCRMGDPRALRVSISEKKLRKLKTRAILSFKSYVKTNDYQLLRDRLAYATSNYIVRRNGFAIAGGLTHVKSGIYYNYRHCGVYAVEKGIMTQRGYDRIELKALDGFLRSLLSSTRSDFATILKATLTPAQLSSLKTYSFSQGFEKRMIVRYRSDRVSQIKTAWKHA